jgi:hypothetical protein
VSVSADARATPDDRVLSATRALSLVIVPFLVVAFAVLFPWPTDTDRLFAWTIKPTFTAMLLGSVYLGGAYFFVRAAQASQWHTIKAGFLSVTTFATLMGIATLLHWGKFNHHHLAFWLWVGLYFTTPFLVFGVWFTNRRHEAPPRPDDPLVALGISRVIGIVGVLAVATSAFCFLAPERAIRIWPWPLTLLTARVTGAVLALGIAAIGAFAERRWSAMRVMVQVEVVMLALILVAAVRARSQFDTGRPLTWAMAAGLLLVLVGSLGLYARMSRSTVRSP